MVTLLNLGVVVVTVGVLRYLLFVVDCCRLIWFGFYSFNSVDACAFEFVVLI